MRESGNGFRVVGGRDWRSNRRPAVTALNGVAPEFRTDRSIRPGDTHILVVECEPMVTRCVSDVFRSPLWTTIEAGTAEEGLAYLRYNLAAVALIQAPADPADWEEAALRWRSLREAPEVIVITRGAFACDKALTFGAHAIVTSPVDRRTLLWTVSGALAAWLARQENEMRGGLCSDA
jgi:DNA-binding response OmpR family regulator